MRRVVLVALAVLAAVLVPATAASAHPLGNFTVNHYDGLTLHPDRLDDFAVIDAAEIPTLQAKGTVDADHDGTVSDSERAAYATARCTALADGLRISVAGRAPVLQVLSSSFAYRPGAVGLMVSRLECRLSAPVDLSRATALAFDDSFDGGGVGWHEVTAAGEGVALRDSPLPRESVSNALLAYPNDLLSSPLDVRGATLDVSPGGASTYRGGLHLPGSNPFSRAVNHLNTTFNSLAGRRHLTAGVGLLAILVAVLLGAGHALLPGHGKTVMAAYLVGRQGRRRDVLVLGSTVTATHTAGVIVLGLVISASSTFAPADAEKWLGVVSGLLVVVVGATLLRSALARRRRVQAAGAPSLVVAMRGATTEERVLVPGGAPAHVHHDHPHDHPHPHAHDHPHPHPHDHEHRHDHGPHGHRHTLLGGHRPPRTDQDSMRRSTLVGLGIAGGLVPSPSALVVLLGAIGLGRTVFGVVLVLAYGVGLALTLTAAGLLMIPLRNRAARLAGNDRFGRAARIVDVLPLLTAVLVVLVGVLLAYRSLSVY